MKTAFWITLSCLSLYADNIAKKLPREHPFSESSTGIKQIDQVIHQLEKSIGGIPPDIEKIAIHQIRIDIQDFSPGVARYVQGRVESALSDKGRRKIAAPPELKTLKIVSTDTSFQISNTLPTIEELWRLGDKLRIDAFIEGSCSRSEEGDVLLNLKLIKHRTAEVLWSADLIAGPNKINSRGYELTWSASAPIRIFPVRKITQTGSPTITEARLDNVSLEGGVREALIASRRLYYSINAGLGMSNISNGDTINLELSRFATMQLSVKLSTVIIQKQNPDLGYWLGTYIGGRFTVPFSFTGSFPALLMGYEAQVSKHFAVSFGVQYLPLTRRLKGSGLLPDSDGVNIYLESFAYELDVLNYTF